MGRMEFEQSKSNQRIEKLAGFQIKILRNALTKYPEAKRVVYSTCSIFPEENEDVVRQVLETNATFKLVPAMKFVNETWKNFGSPEYGNLGSYCLYAKPNEDFTNGFFVAVFERLEEGEENEFFNTKIYNFKKHVQSQEKRKMRQQKMTNYRNANDNEKNHEDYGNRDIEEWGSDELEDNTNGSGKKRKYKESNDVNVEDRIEEVTEDNGYNRNRKKKKKSPIPDQVDTGDIKIEKNEIDVVDTNDVCQKKKKKKQRSVEDDNTDGILKEEKSEDGFIKADDSVRKKKKKKSCEPTEHWLASNNVVDGDVKLENEELGPVNDSGVGKKKKKRKCDSSVEAFDADNVTKDVIKAEKMDAEIGDEEVNKEGKIKKKKKKKIKK